MEKEKKGYGDKRKKKVSEGGENNGAGEERVSGVGKRMEQGRKE